MTEMEILSDTAHECQGHLKLVPMPRISRSCLCPFRASSAATHNMMLFVQQSSTPTAHICTLIFLSLCSEPAPVPHLNTEPLAIAKEHRRAGVPTQKKGWGAKQPTCSQMAEMCPKHFSICVPEIKSDLALPLNIKLKTQC